MGSQLLSLYVGPFLTSTLFFIPFGSRIPQDCFDVHVLRTLKQHIARLLTRPEIQQTSNNARDYIPEIIYALNMTFQDVEESWRVWRHDRVRTVLQSGTCLFIPKSNDTEPELRGQDLCTSGIALPLPAGGAIKGDLRPPSRGSINPSATLGPARLTPTKTTSPGDGHPAITLGQSLKPPCTISLRPTTLSLVLASRTFTMCRLRNCIPSQMSLAVTVGIMLLRLVHRSAMTTTRRTTNNTSHSPPRRLPSLAPQSTVHLPALRQTGNHQGSSSSSSSQHYHTPALLRLLPHPRSCHRRWQRLSRSPLDTSRPLIKP